MNKTRINDITIYIYIYRNKEINKERNTYIHKQLNNERTNE